MRIANGVNQSLIKTIFLNPKLIEEAQRAEKEMAKFPVDTLLDALLIPTNWSYENSIDWFSDSSFVQEIREYLLGSWDDDRELWIPSEGNWKQFRMYNSGACKYMTIRSYFVVELRNNYPQYFTWVLDSNIKKHQLEKLSQHLMAVDYPNIAWAIKILALRKGFTDFNGVQANTTPCRKASEFLFNKSYNGDQFGHSLLCKEISTETGLSMMNANSVLWAMGSKL